MQFHTQLRRARITYAIVMATTTCTLMSAVSTYILSSDDFWHHWPKVLMIDLAIANPVAIVLGPFIRKLCLRLYPDLKR